MLKLVIVSALSIVVSCGAFFGYQWYENRPTQEEKIAPSVSMEETKTDFISVAIFKNGKVDGYVTFRAKLMLKDPSRLPEAGYLIADAIHRKLDTFSQLFGEKFELKDTKLIEDPLLSTLIDRLGSSEVASLTLVDIAYDKRIQ
jgi:hypothetical protein